MAAPAARVQTRILQTLHSIFSSGAKEEPVDGIPASETLAASTLVASLQRPTPVEANVSSWERAASAGTSAQPPVSAAPSKLKAVMRWALPILAMTALAFSVDFGTKLLATKYLFSVFHECAWRTPIIAGIIPYIGFAAYKARSSLPDDRTVWHWSAKQLRNGRLGFYRAEISGLQSMIKDHPSLRWLVRLYDVSIALMFGGMLGNGLDALRLGGALDWIPLGRSLMNFADISLLPGLALFQLATHFFIKAGEAHHDQKPLYFSTGGFLGLPLVGFFIAWAFGSAAGGGALDLAMKNIGFLYLMGFSMLIGISRFLAAMVVDRFAAKFVAEQGQKKA
jgi:hypothetical protein